jgi:hypothetical protein
MSTPDPTNTADKTDTGGEANPPTVKNSGDAPQVGSPSVPSLGRGVLKNTTINSLNNSISHMCDFSYDVQKSVGLKKFLKAIANTIRQGIRAIMRTLGLTDPSGTGSQLINYLKGKLSEIKAFIKKYVQKIQDFIKFVVPYIKWATAMMAWIVALPAAFVVILADCLRKLIKAVASVFSDAWKESATEVL